MIYTPVCKLLLVCVDAYVGYKGMNRAARSRSMESAYGWIKLSIGGTPSHIAAFASARRSRYVLCMGQRRSLEIGCRNEVWTTRSRLTGGPS